MFRSGSLLLALALLWTPACGSSSDAPAIGEGAAASGEVDPRAYREHLEGIESILYSSAPPKAQTAGDLSALSAELAQILIDSRPPRPCKAAGVEMLGWSEQVGVVGDVGYSTVDLVKSRRSWEEMRNKHFRDADWFKRSTDSLDGAQTSRSENLDPMQVTLVEMVAGELESLVKKGRAEAMEFGEIAVDVPEVGSEATKLANDWRDWSQGWAKRMDGVDWPARPPLHAEKLGLAYSALADAGNELRTMLQDGSDFAVPAKSYRQQKLDTAARRIQEARGYIAEIKAGR